MNSIDTDGSGKIDYTEFLAATMEKSVYMKEEKLHSAF
jgi:calcium-dependent protein kinase